MMIIIKEELDLNKNDNLTHRRFPFKLNQAFDKIIIKLSYGPRFIPDKQKIDILEEAVEKYLSDPIYTDEERRGTLEAKVENFLTTSLFSQGKFLGAYHNKANYQEIIVSKEYSSRGYKKHEINPGNYELVLSMHSCNCNVKANLSLEAIND